MNASSICIPDTGTLESECKTTNITLMLSTCEEQKYTLETGFRLKSTPEGHFVEKIPYMHGLPDLKLSDGDHLLAVDRNCVTDWYHSIVLETLKYSLSTTQECSAVSLLVARQKLPDHGKKNILQITITVEQHRVPTGLTPRGSLPVELRSMLDRITYQPRIINVQFKDLYQCKIRHGCITNCYLRVDEKEKLAMETITDRNKDCYEFDCYSFQCLEMCARPVPKSIYICVLRSCRTINDERPYVMAKNCEKIGLMAFDSLVLELDDSTKADPRFFRVRKSSNGFHLFESLIYENYYMTWKSGKLKMEKHPLIEVSSPADHLSGCQFDMICMKDIAKM